jgi:hypothetical protein
VPKHKRRKQSNRQYVDEGDFVDWMQYVVDAYAQEPDASLDGASALWSELAALAVEEGFYEAAEIANESALDAAARADDYEVELRRLDMERRLAEFDRVGDLGASMGASLGSSLASGCVRGCYTLAALLAALTALLALVLAAAAARRQS